MKPTAATRDLLLLLLIVLTGLALRVYHLSWFPLWRDEAFTRYFSDYPLQILWTTGFAQESNPPGYYTLIHLWMAFFGTSEAALRFPSVLAATVTIALVYALGKELAGSKIGLAGALIFALCPSEIWYAQEARTYATFQVPLALMLLSLARFLKQPKSVLNLALYAVTATSCVYLHYSTLFLIVACNLAVLSAILGKFVPLNRRDLVNWIIANGCVAVALLPVYHAMRGQIGNANITWVQPFSCSRLLVCLSDMVAGSAAELEFTHRYTLLFLLVLGIGLHRLSSLDRRIVTVLLLVPIFFIGVVILASLKQSLLVPRIFLWNWIPLSLLLGLVLSHRRPMCWIVLAATAVLFGFGLKAHYFSGHVLKENWRDIQALEPEQIPPAGTLVLGPLITTGPLAYYHPELIPRVKTWWNNSTPQPYWMEIMNERFNIPNVESDALRQEIASGKPISLLILPEQDVSDLPHPDRVYHDVLGDAKISILRWNEDAIKATLPPK